MELIPVVFVSFVTANSCSAASVTINVAVTNGLSCKVSEACKRPSSKNHLPPLLAMTNLRYYLPFQSISPLLTLVMIPSHYPPPEPRTPHFLLPFGALSKCLPNYSNHMPQLLQNSTFNMRYEIKALFWKHTLFQTERLISLLFT
jgi:hypothetical protein